MKYLPYFTPNRQGIIIGAAIGIATNNIAVGIILILLFSFASYVKIIKN